LFYVKAHSGEKYNEEADVLANSAALNHSESHASYNFKILPSTLGQFSWRKEHIIDQNIRKWICPLFKIPFPL
jgi:hypothetical protein